MLKIKKFFQFYSLPLLSGFLMGTSYIPFPPWALFFCYIPLWLFALKQKQLKPLLIGAWLCQFVGALIGFNWVTYTIHEFGFFPWPLAILGFLIFASFANLHIPMALLFWFISQKKLKKINSIPPFLILLLLPLYFTLCMEYYPMIFKWNFGYTWLYAKWPASQTAELWGFQFLHTLTLFSHLFFLLMFKINSKDKNRITLIRFTKALQMLAIWVLLFTGLNLYGQYLKARWPEADKKARILIVQPNIENLSTAYKRLKTDPRPLTLSKLIDETQKVFNKNTPPDFILWPEGTYPYYIKHEGKITQENFAQIQAQKWQSPIVLSATGKSSKGISNSIFVF